MRSNGSRSPSYSDSEASITRSGREKREERRETGCSGTTSLSLGLSCNGCMEFGHQGDGPVSQCAHLLISPEMDAPLPQGDPQLALDLHCRSSRDAQEAGELSPLRSTVSSRDIRAHRH